MKDQVDWHQCRVLKSRASRSRERQGRMKRIEDKPLHLFLALGVALLAMACAPLAVQRDAATARQDARIVRIQRTAHGVAHVEAPDYESLAYGVAYAHAQDNVCQTADHLLT